MEGHIFTDSVIEKGYLDGIKAQIQRIGVFDELVHHISSPGGDVYEGYDTYHFLRGLGKPIKTIVEGQCQSIATFIALAGDKIIMLNPSRWMVHEASIPPMGIVRGDADSLERSVIELRKINAEMAQIYAAKTKQSIESIVQIMKKETPMTAYDAKQIGFVDMVIDSIGDLNKYQSLKAVALGKNMEENVIMKALQSIENRFEAFLKKTPVANSPVAMDLALKSGGMLNVMSENGDLVEKPATVDGQPAPDGEHELADGRVVVIAGGIVKEVKEGMTPEQKEIADLKAQLNALQVEKAAAEAAKQSAETQVATVKTEMQEIQKEVVALKKMTIGDPNPAGKGKIQNPTATDATGDVYKQLQREILQKAGLLN